MSCSEKKLLSTPCFTRFNSSIATYHLPERFTFPYYYEPHPLCLLAVEELQQYLMTQTSWQHSFGLSSSSTPSVGKMFGVLLVKNRHAEIGYLSAFSGKLADRNLVSHFVPPVFDGFSQDDHFLASQRQVNRLNQQIAALAANAEITVLQQQLNVYQQNYNDKLKQQQSVMLAGRKQRKAQRESAERVLNETEFNCLKIKLAKESVQEKKTLSKLKNFWNLKIAEIETALHYLLDHISALKTQRKNLSNNLQTQLFSQYRFLNQIGEQQNLNELFKNTAHKIPPAGAGECAAPKLLQYAFQHRMKPLALAEFWWGKAPKSEIRQHQNFYPACQGKCQPILTHMLAGIVMDENPLLINTAQEKEIAIVYQDEVMAIINKPAEMLSVPGKNIADCVYSRMKQRFPQATGPLIVHRLDMSTSGLMVVALTKAAHKKIQKQFINRTVKKTYLAIVEGLVTTKKGIISLSLRGDINDRPRQMVCEKFGKTAETAWQVISTNGIRTMLYLSPKTGRTHQLRVHCAHLFGLNSPIVGDDLYGKKANRLYLHAKSLAFHHPVTKKLVTFEVDANF